MSKPILNPNTVILASASNRSRIDNESIMLSVNGKKIALCKQAHRTGHKALLSFRNMEEENVMVSDPQDAAFYRHELWAGEADHLLPFIFLKWLMLTFQGITLALLLKQG